MKKQLISFTDPQATFLTNEAKRLGISIAELTRRTVDWYQATYPTSNESNYERSKSEGE